MAKTISKLSKVSESITLNRYDNGWMIEISGRDKKGDYTTCKILCNTEEELLGLVKEWNTIEVDN